MTKTITVEGMSCEHYEQTVEEASKGVSGVRDLEVDRDAERVTVDGDADTEALVAPWWTRDTTRRPDGRNSITKLVAEPLQYRR